MCIAKGILRVSTKFLNMILISLLFFNPQNVADNPFERVQDVTTSLHFKDFAEKFNTRLEGLNSSLNVADLKKHLSADKVSKYCRITFKNFRSTSTSNGRLIE